VFWKIDLYEKAR